MSTNPGVNRYMTGCNRIEDFLAYKDKELNNWYNNEADERLKAILSFVYRAGFRFNLVDAHLLYLVTNIKDIYTDKKYKKLDIVDDISEVFEEDEEVVEESKKKKKGRPKKGDNTDNGDKDSVS